MSDYGVTDKGFVLKRMDTILEEIHTDLSNGFGFDTRVTRPSLLDTLVTTFAGQIADLWETAQASYYAKYPGTAEGVNLDNAVQFGGIRRAKASQTTYPVHCEGDDGTEVPLGTVIATDTKPEKRLTAAQAFTISRNNCNSALVKVAVVKAENYRITIDGAVITYGATEADITQIINGLVERINNGTATHGCVATVEQSMIRITDNNVGRNVTIGLSTNLTTSSVTTIANFVTEETGAVDIPNGLITKIVSSIRGLVSVTNRIAPIYGRDEETDVELRQSYIAKSALRSTTMIDSITAELLNGVDGVKTASGFENDYDVTDEDGLPPHSIEIVVEGGDESAIADVIFNKKAGGIQTYGNTSVDVTTKYGQSIVTKFSRPTYLYTWLKIELLGNNISSDYAQLTKTSVMDATQGLRAGDDLLIQTLHEGIYNTVNGVNYIDIKVAFSTEPSYIPRSSEYMSANIITAKREMVLTDADRIEVTANGA